MDDKYLEGFIDSSCKLQRKTTEEVKTVKEKIDGVEKSIKDVSDKIDKMLLNVKGGNDTGNDILSLKKDMNVIRQNFSAIVSSLETEEERKQRTEDIVDAVTTGINTNLSDLTTQMSNTSTSLEDFRTSLDSRIEDVRKNAFVASLPKNQTNMMAQLIYALSTNTNGLIGKVNSSVSEAGQTAKAEIRKEANECIKSVQEVVKKTKTEIEYQADKAKDEIKDTLDWFRWIVKHKVWSILGFFVFMAAIISGCISSCVEGQRKAAAAGQVIQNANYWDVYEYYNPKDAGHIKQNYKFLLEKRTAKEANRYIRGEDL